MGNLESRIAALERAAPGGEQPVIYLGVYAVGTCKLPEAHGGWSWGTGHVLRLPGEGEDELRARAAAAAGCIPGQAAILTPVPSVDAAVAETSTESMS